MFKCFVWVGLVSTSVFAIELQTPRNSFRISVSEANPKQLDTISGGQADGSCYVGCFVTDSCAAKSVTSTCSGNQCTGPGLCPIGSVDWTTGKSHCSSCVDTGTVGKKKCGTSVEYCTFSKLCSDCVFQNSKWICGDGTTIPNVATKYTRYTPTGIDCP